MQLSKIVKLNCQIFSPFLKAISKFKDFQKKKDDRLSLGVSQIKDCQRHV